MAKVLELQLHHQSFQWIFRVYFFRIDLFDLLAVHRGKKESKKIFFLLFFFPVHRRWECKSEKSRNTWNSRQIWPWSTKRSRQRLTELCQENALVIANTVFQQHKRQLHTWHHQMVNTKIRVIIIFAAEDGETLDSKQKKKKTWNWLWLRSWAPYWKSQT